MQNANIFFIGPMGVGKSTLGSDIANRLQTSFYDSDQLIVQRFGQSIPSLFSQYGERFFRNQEVLTLSDLAKLKKHVLATGGGAVLSKQNREVMRQSGLVIYLSASLHTLQQRLAGSDLRPVLKTQSLEQIVLERHQLYCETAHQQIKTDYLSIEQVAEKVLDVCSKFLKTKNLG